MSANQALTLSDEQLDRLADFLVVKLAQVQPATSPMLTVEQVSATYQVSRAWVYENAHRLGGVKLGPSRRAPLRFDPSKVEAAMSPLGRPDPVPHEQTRPTRRRSRTTHLMPVFDE